MPFKEHAHGCSRSKTVARTPSRSQYTGGRGHRFGEKQKARVGYCPCAVAKESQCCVETAAKDFGAMTFVNAEVLYANNGLIRRNGVQASHRHKQPLTPDQKQIDPLG